MGITANRLRGLGLVDEVLPEPLGGAHRAPDLMAETLQNALVAVLRRLDSLDIDELLAQRQQRMAAVGSCTDT